MKIDRKIVKMHFKYFLSVSSSRSSNPVKPSKQDQDLIDRMMGQIQSGDLGKSDYNATSRAMTFDPPMYGGHGPQGHPYSTGFPLPKSSDMLEMYNNMQNKLHSTVMNNPFFQHGKGE